MLPKLTYIHWIRIFYTALLVILLYQYSCHLLLHQLEQPVFVQVKQHIIYWITHYIYLPQAILQNWTLSFIVDISLFVLIIANLIKPLSKYCSIAFFIVFTLYYICYHSSLVHHEHILVGAWWVALLVCFKKETSFELAWEGMRYYVCMMMVLAAWWKLYNGSLADNMHLYKVLQLQHLDFIVVQPQHWYSHFIFVLLDNPILCTSLWYAAWALEALFIIGFFTKKYDMYLLICFCLFFVMDYVIMGLEFWQLIILCPFLAIKKPPTTV